MIYRNLKFSARNLLKNKIITAINVLGLTLGITVSLVIFSFVRNENTTDNYLPEFENLYVLQNGSSSNCSKHMVDLVNRNIPEIEHITYCGYDWSPQVFFNRNNTNYKINKLLGADSSFFRVFQFEPLWGDPQHALNSANQVVLTQSLAEKIFGNENPVGRELIYNATNLQNEIISVGAVIKDIPQNSAWNFEAVLSLPTQYKLDWYVRNMNMWGTQNYNTFFIINEDMDPNLVQQKLTNISLADVPDDFKSNIDFKLIPYKNSYYELPNVHVLKHGNKLTLSIIQISGLLVLLLACVNYINLFTAQKQKRLKNIGIVKTMGSNRWDIIELVASESALVLLFVMILVIFLLWAFLPGFNNLTQSHFTMTTLFSGVNLIILLIIFLFTLIITGIIPGYSFSKHEATYLLSKPTGNKKGNFLRNGLMVFQFTISIALISSILIISRQNNYLNGINPGFETENIIYVNTNKDIQKKAQSFTQEVTQIPGVSAVTYSSAPLCNNSQNWGRELSNAGKDQYIHFSMLWVSPNFFDFFGIEVLRGNTFTEHSKKNGEYIFNKTAIREFSVNDLSEARVILSDPARGQVIGEVEDINFETLHVPIRAAGYLCCGDADDVAYFKIQTANAQEFHKTLSDIENIWNTFSPSFPIEIQFLDASWEDLYQQDRLFEKVLKYTTFVSLFLSCLGLIGLTIFMMENRTKEIGIRKVNGARIAEVMTMLNKDIIKWILIAFVFAVPAAWFAMHTWLENFAYKTSLSWWIFAAAGVLALVVALITVSRQSWLAATKNPVEALRDE